MKKDNLKAFKSFAILSGLFMLISYIFTGMSVFADDELPPQVYINNMDKPVQAVRGQSLEIPVLIVGGYAQHQQAELYIWREQGSDTYCFDGNEWTLVLGDSTDCERLVKFSALPHHVYWGWTGLSGAEYLENCTLHICFDDMIDGVLTEGSLHCGEAVIEVSEDMSGSSSGGDSGEENNESGSGSGQPSVPDQGTEGPPSFPSPSGDSNNSSQCNSLSYIKAGETFSRSEIRETLEVGATKSFNVSVNACGNPVSVTSVSGGESWMSVSRDGNGGILFQFSTSGLVAGQSTSTVSVTAGGISGTLNVVLTVQGACNPNSVVVNPSTLTFSVVEGNDSDTQYVEVKNGCGEWIDVDELAWNHHDWLDVDENTQGRLSVRTLSADLPVDDSYEDHITFVDSSSGGQHTVHVRLTVSELASPPSNDDVVDILPDNKFHWLSLGPHEALYFRFTTGVSETPDCNRAIGVGNAPSTFDGTKVHVLVKRGSLPDLDDFELTWVLLPPHWICSEGKWLPEESVFKAPDLFWNYNSGSREELITIRQPMEPQEFYIMLYNDSDQSVQNQRLRVYSSSYE